MYEGTGGLEVVFSIHYTQYTYSILYCKSNRMWTGYSLFRTRQCVQLHTQLHKQPEYFLGSKNYLLLIRLAKNILSFEERCNWIEVGGWRILFIFL